MFIVTIGMYTVEAWHPHAILAQDEGARLNFFPTPLHNWKPALNSAGRMGCTLEVQTSRGLTQTDVL